MSKGLDPRVAKVASKISNASTEATQMAILAATAAINNHSGPDGLYVGLSAILGALNPTAMIAAKRPKLSREEAMERGREECVKLIKPETLVYTAILAARMQTNIDSEGTVSCEFGPELFLDALHDCEKVFGKNIDHHLEPGMVAAARSIEQNSAIPLDQFLEKRSQAHNPPTSIQ